MSADVIPQLADLADRIDGWRGSTVEIVEQITRSPGCLDRHLTTTSTLVMRLESAGLAISGSSLIVLGKACGHDVAYQATIEVMDQLSLSPEQVVFVERFGERVERYSTLRLLPDGSE